MINHNRTCNIEDFGDPDISRIIRDVFVHELALFPDAYPDGVADSKQWEIAMAVRALEQFGALHGDARILGVGAGTEATTFYLSRRVRQVLATDIYAGAGDWADVAPSGFLVDPAHFAAGTACDPRRILPLHQDGRALDLPDGEFDGVFSSGSIEHFGSLRAVASAAYEIGRVLKPGGIATIATEFKVAGPPDGDGWDPGVILFSRDKLRRWIVDASGLDPVDALHTDLSDATVSVQRDLLPFLEASKQITHPQQKIGVYPNLILYHEGYLFCSVHLALRKPLSGWGAANQWAAPDAAIHAAVLDGRRAAAAALAGTATQPVAELFSIAGRDAARLAAERDALLARLAAAEQELARLSAAPVVAASGASPAEAELAAVLASTSWRITAPMRRLKQMLG